MYIFINSSPNCIILTTTSSESFSLSETLHKGKVFHGFGDTKGVGFGDEGVEVGVTGEGRSPIQSIKRMTETKRETDKQALCE